MKYAFLFVFLLLYTFSFSQSDDRVKLRDLQNPPASTSDFVIFAVNDTAGWKQITEYNGDTVIIWHPTLKKFAFIHKDSLLPSNNVTGSGTINYIPKFTGTYTLGNSNLTDNGSILDALLPIRFDRNTTVGSQILGQGQVEYDLTFNQLFYHDGTGRRAVGEWPRNGSNIYFNTGNVGIGVTSPSFPIDVNSNSTATLQTLLRLATTQTNTVPFIITQQTAPNWQFKVNSDLSSNRVNTNYGAWAFVMSVNNPDEFAVYNWSNTATPAQYRQFFGVRETGAVFASGPPGTSISTGNFIGRLTVLTSSTSKRGLVVKGEASQSANLLEVRDNLDFAYAYVPPMTALKSRIVVNHASNSGLEYFINNASKWATATYQANTGNFDFTFYNNQTLSDAFFINGDDNNIGFGTTSPSAKVDVVGDLEVSSRTGTATAIGGWASDNKAVNVTVGSGLSLSAGTLSATGSYSGFTPAADSGTGSNVASGGTLTSTGGYGINTSVSGTTVTIQADTSASGLATQYDVEQAEIAARDTFYLEDGTIVVKGDTLNSRNIYNYSGEVEADRELDLPNGILAFDTKLQVQNYAEIYRIIEPESPAASNFFYSADITGDWLALASPSGDYITTDGGGAYVAKIEGDTIRVIQALSDTDGFAVAATSGYGTIMKFNNYGQLIVSGRRVDGLKGKIFIYEKGVGVDTFFLKQHIDSDSVYANSDKRFGGAFDVDGDYLLASNERDPGNGVLIGFIRDSVDEKYYYDTLISTSGLFPFRPAFIDIEMPFAIAGTSSTSTQYVYYYNGTAWSFISSVSTGSSAIKDSLVYTYSPGNNKVLIYGKLPSILPYDEILPPNGFTFDVNQLRIIGDTLFVVATNTLTNTGTKSILRYNTSTLQLIGYPVHVESDVTGVLGFAANQNYLTYSSTVNSSAGDARLVKLNTDETRLNGGDFKFRNGTAVFSDYGAGNKEATDFSITRSGYNAAFGASGTIYETGGVLFTQTANGAVTNTVTETTVTASGVGTLTIPANYLEAGRTIVIKGTGYITNNSSVSLRMRAKLGGTTIGDTQAQTLENLGTANENFHFEYTFTCRSTGASGTIIGQGLFRYCPATGGLVPCQEFDMVNTTTTTINTTTTNTIDVTAQWGAASTDNNIVLTNLIVEAKN